MFEARLLYYLKLPLYTNIFRALQNIYLFLLTTPHIMCPSRRLYPRSWLHHSAVGQISIIGMLSVYSVGNSLLKCHHQARVSHLHEARIKRQHISLVKFNLGLAVNSVSLLDLAVSIQPDWKGSYQGRCCQPSHDIV